MSLIQRTFSTLYRILSCQHSDIFVFKLNFPVGHRINFTLLICLSVVHIVEKFQMVSNELPNLRTSVSYTVSII